MHKLAQVGIITTTENTYAQVIDDTTLSQYSIVQTSAGAVRILGPIPYGKTKRLITQTPQVEVQNTVLIGGATVEVIVAATRYRVEIWNPEADYERFTQGPLIYATVSATTLSGNAYTDRTNVYSALVTKINAYAGNNCTAYGLVKATYSGGTSSGDADTNFVVGETVTQETSTYTAKVAACTIDTGTFAGDNAAGTIWLYALSNETLWLTTQKTLTAAGHVAAVSGISAATTNCVVTVTNATVYFNQGIVLVDDAGYFTSSKTRGGINRVGLTAGFATATATVIITGYYSVGVGTDMLAQRPVFDIGNQALIAGNIEFQASDGTLPVAGIYYKKYILEVEDGDENAVDQLRIAARKHYVLWFPTTTADYVSDLDSELATVVAK
jgi:hypothetical protein